MGESLGASGWPNVITREGPKKARVEKAVGQGKVLFFGKVSLDDVFAEKAWGARPLLLAKIFKEASRVSLSRSWGWGLLPGTPAQPAPEGGCGHSRECR